MSFAGSSESSSNPTLAWIAGNAGKGRMLIKFPFTLDSGWYREQTCTTFRVFQHRKERKGFQHEFVLLKLTNGFVCRFERMGDPNARFNAINPQGSVAHDMAQTFEREDQAFLETSDVLTEITLPCDFDIMEVLLICRAIHEGQKTRNYTLQIYNCWFFTLAIQVCLVRLIAHWEDVELLKNWLSKVNEGVKALTHTDQTNLDQTLAAPCSPLHKQAIFKIYFVLGPLQNDREEILVNDIKRRLQSRLTIGSDKVEEEVTRRINDLLWYTMIGSSLSGFIDEEVKEVVMAILREREGFLTSQSDGGSSSHRSLQKLKGQSLTLLIALLSSEDTRKRPALPQHESGGIKQKSINQTTAESSPKIRPAELTYKGSDIIPPVQVVPPRSLTAGWYPSIAIYAPYFEYFVWWLLDAVYLIWGVVLLSPRAVPTICVLIDRKLEIIAKRLEGLSDITHSDLDHLIKSLRELIGNEAGIWSSSPWSNTRNFIKQYAPDAVLKDIEARKPTVGFCSQPGPEALPEPKRISAFQTHILERIVIHAKMVERNWLGSAAHIQKELEDVLSQVWKEIREDTGLVEKSQSHSRPSAPPPGGVIIRPPDALLLSYTDLQPMEFLNRYDFGREYPPQLEPPNGAQDMRCLFCDERCDGADAESQWRQHVADQHNFVVLAREPLMEGDTETITSNMSIQEIFNLLLRHGCVDLSSRMDPEQYSAVVKTGGGWGDIWKGELYDRTQVAIKTWREASMTHSDYKHLKRAAREIHNWSKMDHENVHNFTGIIMFRGVSLGMVSPWMENGNLHEYLRDHPDSDRLQLSIQVANGLSYTHEQDMVHGDIKAFNVLVSSSGVAKIADFESSTMSESSIKFSATTRNATSIRWAAPELFSEEGEPPKTKESDVYALGMTMLEIFTGTVPYSEIKHDFVIFKILHDGILPKRPEHFRHDKRGDRLWALLQACWDKDPKARPRASEVQRELVDIHRAGAYGSESFKEASGLGGGREGKGAAEKGDEMAPVTSWSARTRRDKPERPEEPEEPTDTSYTEEHKSSTSKRE